MHLYRTFVGDICCEIGLPRTAPHAIIVLCPGLPGTPKEQALCLRLVDSGYAVIYPRHSGTYESNGKFLSVSPADDIILTIQHLMGESFTELYNSTVLAVPVAPIILLGNSFGALVAGNALRAIGDGAILLCPVTDWNTQGTRSTEPKPKEIVAFVQRAYPNVYRTTQWNQIGKLLEAIPLQSTKPITMLFAKKDTGIDLSRATHYKQGNATVRLIPGKHQSFEKLKYSLLIENIETLLAQIKLYVPNQKI